MSKDKKSSLVGRELLAVAVITGAIIFLMLWLVGDRSFLGSLVVGAVLGYVVHYIGASLKNDSYAPPGVGASPVPTPSVAPAATTKPETASAEPATPAPTPEPAPTETGASAGEAVSPTFLAAPGDAGADDLKKIRGVGPKLEQTLNGMGVYHYAQVAAWTEAEVAWVDENLEGFKGRVTRDGWVEQAKALASAGGN